MNIIIFLKNLLHLPTSVNFHQDIILHIPKDGRTALIRSPQDEDIQGMLEEGYM